MSLSALPLFHRVAGERVVVIGEGDAADAKRRLVERAGGVCCGEPEAHYARLGFIALDDPGEAASAAIRLRSKGLLVNVTDRPELCDFTVPSVLERGPVVVAVGTGGASAALAKQLRLRLETMLPQSIGRLAERLYAARGDLRRRWPDAAQRRNALDIALTDGGALDPLTSEAGRVEEWLENGQLASKTQVEEIALASADPDNLTLRQARLLGQADAIVHDAGVPEAILVRARADAIRIVAGNGVPLPGGRVVILRWSGPN